MIVDLLVYTCSNPSLDENPRATVGKLSERCGQKFARDIFQVSSYDIEVSGLDGPMKDLIAKIMETEKEKDNEQAAGIWRFREENEIFYSEGSQFRLTVNYLFSEKLVLDILFEIS